MDVVKIENLQYVTIGREGEHNAETVQIDMTSWVEEFEERGYEGITYYILFKPYDSIVALPVVTQWSPDDDNILQWEITLSNTYTAGVGYAEIRAVRFTEDENDGLELGVVKKSRVIPVTVDKSVTGVEGGTVPAPYDDWVNLVLNTKEQLNRMFREATTSYYGTNDPEFVPEDLPDSSWGSLDLTKNYLWSRISFAWETGEYSYMYTVSYLGLSESGVQSVNGLTGVVNLNATNIRNGTNTVAGELETLNSAVSEHDQTINTQGQTIGSHTESINSLATSKLDKSMIVYGSEPSEKITGMIWLKQKG